MSTTLAEDPALFPPLNPTDRDNKAIATIGWWQSRNAAPVRKAAGSVMAIAKQ